MKAIEIERVVSLINKELEKNAKTYLTLSAANQLLLDEGFMTVNDRANQTLKLLLEQGAISHAYQTESSPKQWRIPHSNEMKREQDSRTIKSKMANCTYCGVLSQQGMHCKGCGQYIIITRDEDDIQIKTDKSFKNSTSIQHRNSSKKGSDKITLTAVIVILLSIILIGVVHNSSKRNSSKEESNVFSNGSNKTQYYIIRDTYAATSMDTYREMFSYIIQNDKRALNEMRLQKDIVILKEGTEIDIVKVRLGYCVIRTMGSRQHLWLEQEAFSKE